MPSLTPERIAELENAAERLIRLQAEYAQAPTTNNTSELHRMTKVFAIGAADLLALIAEHKRRGEALAFYAKPDNWEDHGYENGLHWVENIPAHDGGEVARSALSPAPAEGVKS